MERITNFIHSIIPDVEVIYEDEEFCVNIEERIINVGIDPDPQGDELIQNFIFEKFGVAMDSFLIGVLHEIGHIMTYDEDTLLEGEMLYYMIRMNYNPRKFKEYSYMYFSIPSELAATTWAVNYYVTHQEKCDEFMDLVF